MMALSRSLSPESKGLGFEPLDKVAKLVHLAAQVRSYIFALARKIEVSGNVIAAAAQFLVGG